MQQQLPLSSKSNYSSNTINCNTGSHQVQNSGNQMGQIQQDMGDMNMNDNNGSNQTQQMLKPKPKSALSIQDFMKIVNGYVRESENAYRFIVPNGIQKIITAYYPKKINYVGKFLKQNAEIDVQIQSDQLSFTGFKIARLNEPLPTSMECKEMSLIYRWRAKFCRRGRVGRLQSVIFGITTEDQNDAFGISSRDNFVCDGNLFWAWEEKGYKGFKEDEMICMEYEISEGNKCSLSFYNESKDNQFIRKFDLPKYVANYKKEIKSWYPVFTNPEGSHYLISVVPY